MIISSYRSVYGELSGSINNPVMKIPIVPQGYGDQLYITELLAEDDVPVEREGGGGVSGGRKKRGQLILICLPYRKLVATTWSR